MSKWRMMSRGKYAKPNSEERKRIFWSKVDIRNIDECWPYKEFKDKDGYGKFWDGHTKMYAHRYAYEIHNNCKVPNDRYILHKCDNPSCCNPYHLYCGTQQDNMNDVMFRKRIDPEKIALSHAKLHNKEIILIREMIESGLYSQRALGTMFRIGKSTISEIKRRSTYPCVEGYYV